MFVLSEGGLKVFAAPSRKILQQQVIEYRKVISDKDNHDFTLGNVLFKELVLPGLDKGTRKIIFVPDDILNLLPFETLVSDEKTTRWLVQDHPISYVPSLSSLRELNRRRAASRMRPHKDLLAFGDPFYGANEDDRRNANQDIFQDFYANSSVNFFRLKFSGLEIQKIAAAFKPSRTDAFLRQDATEDRLKAEPLTDYRIIHFATHGLIDDKKPARSSIILALDRDPGEDGFLQMREIFNLRMNADLVTLSACQTGLGPFIRGEGIEGLSRAFFYAGASSVLISLWAVNDEATYQLMERFYRHLMGSETPANALRQAKLEMIDSGVLSHPYYWAGFIVNGKSDTVIFPGTLKRWAILASSSVRRDHAPRRAPEPEPKKDLGEEDPADAIVHAILFEEPVKLAAAPADLPGRLGLVPATARQDPPQGFGGYGPVLFRRPGIPFEDQVFVPDDLFLAQDVGPFDDILQLSDVAREIIGHEPPQRFRREVLALAAPLVLPFEDLMNEAGDVLPSLPQRRKPDPDDIDPEV